MHILVAPNAFKNTCSATDAALALAEGLKQSRLDCSIQVFPVGDGGDGTAELLISRLNGIRVNVAVHDPLGRIIDSGYGLVHDGRTAIIEMADASGIKLLKQEELDPLRATSYGTGELMKHALERGVGKIVLCIGGSATVDGGIGILAALGMKLKTEKRFPEPIPALLSEVVEIDLSEMHQSISNCKVIVLCDVDNKLLGKDGAAAVFGPQKGAADSDVRILDDALTHWRNLLLDVTGKDIALLKYGGAAGGVSAGLHAVINAELVNGIEYFLQASGFDDALENADLVITGEGSIDAQTMQGKAPFGVAVRSKQKGKPVIGVSGRLPVCPDEAWYVYFDSLLSITHSPGEADKIIYHTIPNLTRTGKEIGNLLSLRDKK